MHESRYKIQNAPRIALLADLHNRPYEQILASVSAHGPDIICVPGDVLYGSRPVNGVSPVILQENVLPFLEKCVSIAPTFFSIGNHEWMLTDSDLSLLSSTGITLLNNNWLKYNGFVIGGLTSGYFTEYRKKLERLTDRRKYRRKEGMFGINGMHAVLAHMPDVSWLDEYAAVPGFHILLCHHPEYFRIIPDSVGLILSGHAHGGQWRFLGQGVYAPGQGTFPEFTKGVYKDRLVVSAGLSNTVHVPRLLNPREIVYIHGTE